ncbi:MAG: hypothetical protein ACKESB_02715 [Candidatus Hodgkinia cicadicola]
MAARMLAHSRNQYAFNTVGFGSTSGFDTVFAAKLSDFEAQPEVANIERLRLRWWWRRLLRLEASVRTPPPENVV